jgi:hypothetical protein
VDFNFKRTRKLLHQGRSQAAIAAIAKIAPPPNSVTKEGFSQHQELNIPANDIITEEFLTQ